MKNYKYETSGVNKKGQRTPIFSMEFKAKNDEELQEDIKNFQKRYCKENEDLDFISFSLYEIIEIKNEIIKY